MTPSLRNAAALAAVLLSVCCSSMAQPAGMPAGADQPGSATMPPGVRESAMPEKPKKPGQVKLGVWIREDGTVERADFLEGSKSWKDACIAAAMKVRFEPVMWEGHAIPARTELVYSADRTNVTWSMSPVPNLPNEVHQEGEFGLEAPVIKTDPDFILPLAVRADGRRIEAGLRYVVEPDGSTGRIECLGASSEGALRSALDLVSQRAYQPATIGGKPVAFAFQQAIGFRTMDPVIPDLEGAVEVIDPVYPYERLLAQEEGHATVRFVLDGNGRVQRTELLEASHPDFGGALIAAIESWSFSTAAVAAKAVREYRHDFRIAQAPYAARRIVDGIREGKPVPKSGAGLDARPRVLGRPTLAYPTVLFVDAVPGSAKVEFVIDRAGLAQMPRVLEATHPAFGWAAATMVNGMRFEPLTRGGKPTELTVAIPVVFEAPKKDAPLAAVR